MEESNKPVLVDKPADKKKSKKMPLIIALIVGGVLILAGIGVAIWLLVGGDSDEKVLNDTFYNVLSNTEVTTEIKASATIEGAKIGATIKVNGSANGAALAIKDISIMGTSIGTTADLVVDKKGDIYIKLGNPKDLAGLLSGLMGEIDVTAYLDGIADKWIKISPEDLQGVIAVDTESAGDKCFENVISTVTTKKAAQEEILNAITGSEILGIERIAKDEDGLKFELTSNLNNTQKFVEEIMKTELYEAISDCASALEGDVALPTEADSGDINWDSAMKQIDELRNQLSVKVYFWVNAKDRQPTRLSANIKASEPKIEFNLDITYKPTSAEVTAPSDSVKFTEVLQSIIMSSYGY